MPTAQPHTSASGPSVLGCLPCQQAQPGARPADMRRDSVAIRPRRLFSPSRAVRRADGERHLDYLAEFTDKGLRLARGIVRSARAQRADPPSPIRYSRGMREVVVALPSTTPSWISSTAAQKGLDPLMQRAFYEILDELRTRGRVFFSSHVLSEVERVCVTASAWVQDGTSSRSRTWARSSREAPTGMRIVDGPAPDLSTVPPRRRHRHRRCPGVKNYSSRTKFQASSARCRCPDRRPRRGPCRGIPPQALRGRDRRQLPFRKPGTGQG